MNAWQAMAGALSEVKARRLYREDHKSFKEYLAKRWNISRSHAYRLVNAHKTSEKLSPTGDTAIPATNERQLRELVKVPEDKRADVLKEAQKKAGKGRLTNRHIRQAAQELSRENSPQNGTSVPSTAETPKRIAANIIRPAEVFRDAKILPLGELSKLAEAVHAIFLDPSRHEEAKALLFKLKENLRLYAELEAKHPGEVPLTPRAVAQPSPGQPSPTD